MNRVDLIGNLARDPDFRTGDTERKAYARFTLAVNRGKDASGKDLGADFPSIVCFGKTAELVNQYLKKGRKVAVVGKIQTGSYEKDGKKIYTTDILAERVEFLDKAEGSAVVPTDSDVQAEIPEGFAKISDDDIPF